MIKVSVVIPVYNGEEYLVECIESLLSQTYTNIELICINDGSTDNTVQILQEFLKIDKRVKVLSQDNCGVVTARKRGVQAATGEYVLFVDADDYLYKDSIEQLLSEIDGYDVLTFGIDMETKSGSIVLISDAIEEGIYDTPSKMEYLYSNMLRANGRDSEGILQFLFAKLYKRTVLNEIIDVLNPNIHYAEDRELIYRYMLKAKTAKITHKSRYFYRYRSTSVIHTANSNVMQDLCLLYHSLNKLFRESMYSELLLPQLDQTISSRVYMITKYMGFSPRNQTVRFIIPFYNELYGKRLALYGAGEVGWSYYKQTMGMDGIDWIIWVDRNPKDHEVDPVERLLDMNFDLVVIAVHGESIALDICSELISLGIEKRKLIWKEPIALGE